MDLFDSEDIPLIQEKLLLSVERSMKWPSVHYKEGPSRIPGSRENPWYLTHNLNLDLLLCLAGGYRSPWNKVDLQFLSIGPQYHIKREADSDSYLKARTKIPDFVVHHYTSDINEIHFSDPSCWSRRSQKAAVIVEVKPFTRETDLEKYKFDPRAKLGPWEQNNGFSIEPDFNAAVYSAKKQARLLLSTTPSQEEILTMLCVGPFWCWTKFDRVNLSPSRNSEDSYHPSDSGDDPNPLYSPLFYVGSIKSLEGLEHLLKIICGSLRIQLKQEGVNGFVERKIPGDCPELRLSQQLKIIEDSAMLSWQYEFPWYESYMTQLNFLVRKSKGFAAGPQYLISGIESDPEDDAVVYSSERQPDFVLYYEGKDKAGKDIKRILVLVEAKSLAESKDQEKLALIYPADRALRLPEVGSDAYKQNKKILKMSLDRAIKQLDEQALFYFSKSEHTSVYAMATCGPYWTYNKLNKVVDGSKLIVKAEKGWDKPMQKLGTSGSNLAFKSLLLELVEEYDLAESWDETYCRFQSKDSELLISTSNN